MKIEKYNFEQTELHSEEVFTTLKELQTELSFLNKQKVKNWIVDGDKKHGIIKSGKIKLYKRDANT